MIEPEQATGAPGIRSTWMIALASAVGLGVYLYPFALPTIHQTASGNTRAGEAPIVLCGLILLCLAAILREIDPMRHGEGAARIVALLASMVAIGAIARLIPSFLGASPIFLLVILGGYVFGPAFGFQLGALVDGLDVDQDRLVAAHQGAQLRGSHRLVLAVRHRHDQGIHRVVRVDLAEPAEERASASRQRAFEPDPGAVAVALLGLTRDRLARHDERVHRERQRGGLPARFSQVSRVAPRFEGDATGALS